jgi:hypothetical protein
MTYELSKELHGFQYEVEAQTKEKKKSRTLKCFNSTCKCGNIELERVLKIRCKNCHCSIIYDIEQIHLLGAVERAALLAYKQINRDQQNT